MTFKFQKGIFTSVKTIVNRLLDFCGELYNFEINCTYLLVSIGCHN
jgi:hypothetical protein